MAIGSRWLLPLLLMIGLPLAACEGERPAPPADAPPAAAVAKPAAPAVPASPQAIPGPNVTVLPDGSAVLRPPVGDVAMLRRMPDGTFKRVCGPPEADMRDLIEAKMRARRGGQ